MRSEFGCLECCIATIFGCDLDQVPSPPERELSKVEELEARAALHDWVRDRGYRMRYSEIGRHLFDRFWIGISVDPRPGWDHTVVCFARSVVFDPALGVPLAPGYAVESISTLHYAISFDRQEEGE